MQTLYNGPTLGDPKVKQAIKLALLLLLLMSAPLSAGTIDFENMPQAYWYNAGQQNFGNYWQGVDFGPESTILENQVYGYNDAGYPPHSGHAVLFSISVPYIDAVFDTPIDNVSLWYTSASVFVMDAYDSSNNLIGSSVGPSNYGTNSFLQVSSGLMNIKRVRMHDSGNYFTVDDFTAEFVTGDPNIPEPSSFVLSALGLIGLGVYGWRRKR